MNRAQALKMGGQEASRIDDCAYCETVCESGVWSTDLFFKGEHIARIPREKDNNFYDFARQWVDILGDKVWILICSENINEITGGGHAKLIELVKALSK